MDPFEALKTSAAGGGGPPGTFVSRILRVALGLFVTTAELPSLSPEQARNVSLGYDCLFDAPCRWSSLGNTQNHWLQAKGEPEALIWLAATGTTITPKQPFSLIELRGQEADTLTSYVVKCQRQPATLRFTYWTIGEADLEICLLDGSLVKFNCTGLLNSHIQPGKVALSIPVISHPFHISLIPNNQTGVLILDDIQYDAPPCEEVKTVNPFFPEPKTRELISKEPPTPPTPPAFSTTQVPLQTTPLVVTIQPAITRTETPFDLLIVGHYTKPLFDRRTGAVIDDTTSLLCDFGNEFPCLWGAEAGKWAIVDKGAIPSLEATAKSLPSFPSALVIQGAAMFSSDPIRCQKGSGSLLFRYWTNGPITLQVCALGDGENSRTMQCTEEHSDDNLAQNGTLGIFEFRESIDEPFTLNIVPIWENDDRNQYFMIDEIAYMGNCSNPPATTVRPTTTDLATLPPPRVVSRTSLSRFIKPLTPTTIQPTYRTRVSVTTTVQPETVSPRRRIISVTPEEVPVDYCALLNCNFDENACNYLNHGLTKVPWTLRNKGYGFPLSRITDIRPLSTNHQFVSTILGPGDFAILESPVFNMSQGINVLLFQYYRPTHATTIRLCLGTSYTKPLQKVSSFTQCPPILRSLTSKNAYKWNTAHIQLPPGTTHFYLVAHNLDKASEKSAIALDNMRVAICDPRAFEEESMPDYSSEL